MLFRTDIIADFKLSEDNRRTYIDSFMKAMGFIYMGEGRMRRTFRSPDGSYVLKFPMTESGVFGNEREHEKYRKSLKEPDPDGIEYAPCRLIQGTVLMMWAVQDVFGYSDGCRTAFQNGTLKRLDQEGPKYPAWAGLIDCQQVGVLANGKVVAYDYT